MSEITSLCPCGSGQLLDACCGPLLAGELIASTPEQLMRSRFSAFCLGNHADYLFATWHPVHCPVATAAELAGDSVQWQKLEVRASSQHDDSGEVTFCAWYRDDSGLHPYVERSEFVREQGRWLYTTGEALPYVRKAKVKPNDPCPCGSGKKYKKCCG